MRIIDLSQVIKDGMPVYPGDVVTKLAQTRFLQTDKYNNHRLEIGMHTGAHVDSPLHMTGSTEFIAAVPAEAFLGEGCLLDVRNQSSIGMKEDYEALVQDNSVVLLYTGWDKLYGAKEYYEGHPRVEPGFGRFLREKRIKMLGMDMPSPDKYPFEVHKLLHASKIYLLENLTIFGQLLGAKTFEVIALPVKLKADGAMTRAVARILASSDKAWRAGRLFAVAMKREGKGGKAKTGTCRAEGGNGKPEWPDAASSP